MAIGKKTGGRDFKKGKSGNPAGRTPLPGDIKGARALNKLEFERIANKYLYLTGEEIQAVVKDPNTPALEVMVASIVFRAIKDGDQFRLNFLLDRLIGKVTEKIEHSGTVNLADRMAKARARVNQGE